MILVIDNYDSFTYNLVQYFGRLRQTVTVARNDKICIEDIVRLKPRALVISPGPGIPQDAGVSCEVIRRFGGSIPLLGVCLGHQAIGYAFGASIVRAPRLMHGKTSQITHDSSALFRGIRNPFAATRYHSLVIDESTLPRDFKVTARSEDGLIMAIAHRDRPLWGVQFHPESILTRAGLSLLDNFLSQC